MNWKQAAISDLQQYHRQRDSLTNIRERIAALRSKYEAVRGASTATTPVQGGSSRMEDRLLSNIVERERLKHTYRAAEKLVRLTERGLAGLDERERLVLERFYVTREKGHVERLMDELGYEQRRIYQIKDEALYKFTIMMYGLIDY